jgi:mannose-6-phosphate isomerase-like protein (cupin superfamily)
MLSGVLVELSGPTMRQGETTEGQANFSQLQAGTYRLRFSGDAVTTFEREVTLASGKPTPLDISLSPAPPPREVIKEIPAPKPETPAAAVGPLGQTQLTSLYAMAEKELKSKSPKRETLVACSGNLRSTMVILAEKEQMQRKYEGAEVSYYVLGGDATVRVAEKDTNLAAGGYVAMPRGVAYTISPKGKNSLALLALLSGEPCEQAR